LKDIINFAIFFTVYLVLSLLINLFIRKNNKKELKRIANESFYAAMIYTFILILIRMVVRFI